MIGPLDIPVPEVLPRRRRVTRLFRRRIGGTRNVARDRTAASETFSAVLASVASTQKHFTVIRSGEEDDDLQDPQIPNLADLRRTAQDQFGDVLGKQRTRNIRGYVFDNLRRNLHDKVIWGRLQAVLVGNVVIHFLGNPTTVNAGRYRTVAAWPS